MKYTVETTEMGFIETLEVGGRVLVKHWTGDGGDVVPNVKEFADELVALGTTDEEILNRIYDTLDENYIGMDLKKIDLPTGSLDAHG